MNEYCTQCGTRLVNGVCPNCSSSQTAPQYQQPNTQYQQQNYQNQQPPVEINPNDERFKSFFMSPKEKFVCALGNGYLMNFLAGWFLGKGFAVVSDKRVYFKGTTFELGEKKITRRTASSTVDLKDVTGTEVRTVNFFALLAMGWGLLALGVFSFIMMFAVTEPDTSGAWAFGTVGGTFLVLSLVFVLVYKLSRKTLLAINYAGGCIAFDINWYPRQEGDNFQKMLRIAKDNAVEEAENATANTVREAMSNVGSAQYVQQAAPVSAADELAKYAQLYKDGLITEQEFADIKAKFFAKQ